MRPVSRAPACWARASSFCAVGRMDLCRWSNNSVRRSLLFTVPASAKARLVATWDEEAVQPGEQRPSRRFGFERSGALLPERRNFARIHRHDQILTGGEMAVERRVAPVLPEAVTLGHRVWHSSATPQGPARLMFAPDLVGSSAQIAERLYSHAAFREINEVAFALPFTFDHDDYVQILTDIATKLGPALGWQATP